MAGTFDEQLLLARDDEDITLAAAMNEAGFKAEEIAFAKRSKDELLGFVEVHIEQGPVLDTENLPVGVVSSIAGASRFHITIEGQAGHAGTVPMPLRRDALVAASEVILTIERLCTERERVVGTVGRIAATPGAINVIPGRVELSLDVRAGSDRDRETLIASIDVALDAIAAARKVTIATVPTHENDAVSCDDKLSTALAAAISECNVPVKILPSGAGHDAMAMAAITPVAMLFVRCAAGISHHPDESMTAHDADVAARVLMKFLIELEASIAP